MKKYHSYIALCGLSAVALFPVAIARPATAGTIRIIGDRTPAAQNNFGEPKGTEPPSSSVRGSTIISITGDKQGTVRKPAGVQPPVQPAVIETVGKEHTAQTTAEGESLSKETAEQQLINRIESLKAEEARKGAEKAAQDRPARLKAGQENEAGMQGAIEQEQQAAEPRKAAEQRSDSLTADEECLAAAMMACQGEDTQADQTAPAGISADTPTASSIVVKPATPTMAEPLPAQNPAKEPAQPKSVSPSGLSFEYWLLQMRTKFQEQWRMP